MNHTNKFFLIVLFIFKPTLQYSIVFPDSASVMELQSLLTPGQFDAIKIQLQATTVKDLRAITHAQWESINSISIIDKTKIREVIASEDAVMSKIINASTIEGK